MKHLVFEQFLPVSMEKAWTFFSSPENLNLITPPEMKFEILVDLPEEVHTGLMIHYRIRPMLNIPMRWTTEITAVEKHQFFIDEQIRGPYRVWHHEHHFRKVDGGVWMTDKLNYDVGWGVFGWLAGKLWVDKQVQEIFEYRKGKLEELFP